MGEKFLVCHHPSGNFAGTDDDEPLLVGHYKLLSRETSILPPLLRVRSSRFYSSFFRHFLLLSERPDSLFENVHTEMQDDVFNTPLMLNHLKQKQIFLAALKIMQGFANYRNASNPAQIYQKIGKIVPLVT